MFSFIHLNGQNIDVITNGIQAELRIESSMDMADQGNSDLWLRRSNDSYYGSVSMGWWKITGNTPLGNDFSFGVYGDDILKINRFGYDVSQIGFSQSIMEISGDANLDNVYDDPAILIQPNFGRLRFGTAIGGSTIIGNSGGAGIRISTFNLIPEQNNVTRLGSSGFRFIGVYSAGGVFSSSDAKLKRDIIPIAYGIQELLKLKPVQYYWKNSSDSKIQLGLLAQDLEKVVPEAVIMTEILAQRDGSIKEVESVNYGINYDKLLPVMIRAVQENQHKIEEISIQLNALIAEMSN